VDSPTKNDFPGLEALEAQLAAFEGRPDEGLAALAGKEDPESIRTRLLILLEAKRFAEAADLVRDKSLNARWCEQGVAALAANGETKEASRLVTWSHDQPDVLLWPSCLIALATHRCMRVIRGLEAKPILPGELSAEDASCVRECLDDLSPIVTTVKAQQRILTGIEATAVSQAMEFCYLLGEREEYRSLADLLWKRHPIPLDYARAVLRKAIPPHPDLPKRLREERSESFEAKRMACAVDGTLLGKTNEAIQEAERLLDEYSSLPQQEQIAELLLEIAKQLPANERNEIEERVSKLLGARSRYARFKSIEEMLKKSCYDQAEESLKQLHDETDPLWLEMMAAVLQGKGKSNEAATLLIRATEQHPDPSLLRKAAAFATRNQRKQDAIQLYVRLLRAEPEDDQLRVHLASLLMETGDYKRAAEQFHELRKRRPADEAPAINEAVALALALRYDESLRVYQSLCLAEPPPLRALLGQATLLKAINRAADGFKVLERHRDTFWNQPDFLTVYMDLGYAAKREQEAQQGFLRLHQLQERGDIERVLHAADINELLQLRQKYLQDTETLSEQVLTGRLPWLLAAQWLSIPAIAAFRERTCPLRWLADTPSEWCRHTLYATNGYVVVPGGDGTRWIQPVRSPERSTRIVVDLSSLIVLDKLGLLTTTADYFGECRYPAAYHAASLKERDRLVIPQPARLAAATKVKSLIDADQIHLLSAKQNLPHVHEHGPKDQNGLDHLYGFRDMIPGLSAGQFVPDDELRDFEKFALRPSGATADYPALQLNDAIQIHSSSLESLELHGMLPSVVSSFRVHVTEQDRARLISEIEGWTQHQLLFDWHASLWDHVTADPRFVPVGHSVPPSFANDSDKPGEQQDDQRSWTALASAFIAADQRIPLMADDRVLHVLAHNDQPTHGAAFSTDSLVARLLQEDVITTERAATVYLKLIGWRYRFLIVPAKVMVHLAKQSLNSPPGFALQQLARYVQDSMRDPGLLGGPEPTEPPLSMAHKLFLEWANEVTSFVFELWDDEAVAAESARTLTRWAMTECMPGLPQSLGPTARLMADQLARHILRIAFVHAASRKNSERVNLGLRAIAETLRVTDTEYLDELVEVVNAL
jgi:tetratricopeptide (TPR) repeat protein